MKCRFQLCRLVIFNGYTGHLKAETPRASVCVCTVWELVCLKAESLRNICVAAEVPTLVCGTIV